MRHVLARLGVRGVVAAVATLLVVGVVAVAKLAGDDRRRTYADSAPQPTISIDPTAGDDGQTSPTPSTYPDDPAVRAAATAFATAWLRRDDGAVSWHRAVSHLATATLADTLKDVDPSGVPATRRTGNAVINLRGDLYAQVSITVDTGTLRLGLVKEGSRWLVDSVDWERA